MSIAGHLVGVTADRLGADLTADLEVGDTVLHVDSTIFFDEKDGGTVLIGGAKLDYEAFDDPDDIDTDTDGPTELTLTAPSTVAADEGDPVWAFDPTTGSDDPVIDYVAMVTIDDRGPGDALPARIRAGLVEQLTSDYQTYLGKAVELDVIDGELVLVDILGSMRAGAVRGKALDPPDKHTVTALGDQTFRLSHIPIPQTEHLRWDGASQDYDDFTRDGFLVTVPDPDGVLEIDDVLTMQYLYTDAAGPNLLSIPMGTVWKYATGLGSSTTFAAPAFDDSAWASAPTPLEAPLYVSPGNVWQRISGVSTGGDLTFTMTNTDNQTKVYLDGALIYSASVWSLGPAVVTVPCAVGGHVIAVYSVDSDGPSGIGQGTGIEIQES